MQKTWQVKRADFILQAKLSQELDIHPLLAQLLINRGVADLKTACDFLNPDLSNLFSPHKLKDMDLAVERVKKAIKKKENVLVFSDYDVDGITSCALLKTILKKMGLTTKHHIPNRLDEGYGLNHNIEHIVKKHKADLLLCLDCGINSFKEIALVNKMGIDAIIIDHHEPLSDKLPSALAIINPKRHDCKYPFKDLASIGLVYKFSQALMDDLLEEELDLVCLGTIADVMSLRGENRIFVKQGLNKIQDTKRKGLKALIEIAGLKDKQITPEAIGYIIAPRLNACGRLGCADKALDLLLSTDESQAFKLAKDLDLENRKRQKLQDDTFQQALNLVESQINFKDHSIIVLSQEGWHKGVLGIVASKITERFYRPTIVISLEKDLGKGSGRSIENFHLFEALTNCSGILEEYGGHRYAVGLTVRKENLEEFNLAINRFAKNRLSIDDLSRKLTIDAELPLSMLNLELIKDIKRLAPFGVGNPGVVFCSNNLKIKGKPIIVGKDTIKFWVSDGKLTVCAVGFGMGNFFDLVLANSNLDLAYKPSLDTWQDEEAILLELKDIRNANDR